MVKVSKFSKYNIWSASLVSTTRKAWSVTTQKIKKKKNFEVTQCKSLGTLERWARCTRNSILFEYFR